MVVVSSMKTPIAKKETVERGWVVIDAENQPVGRLATRIATILRGKNKVNYTPHVDTGDFVVVINADKVKLTGRKLDQKVYYRHTGWPSGIRETVARKMLDEKPERIIFKAVRNMIPNPGFRTGKNFMRKLKIYAGAEHPHAAQKPTRLEL
jgi:large subunit ribosomal protein L13